ncbi:uncharacterized protein LOC111357931 [Spodoptera litura]|uniref:Uncharacterized protein LOC111357931 n=1 Tax=Spodoptera litura TaxID=69820 RepID=A0A9J7ECX4_SPOLT|nr:uncharacterized protein LOC111357931 [Spodoptera litura]
MCFHVAFDVEWFYLKRYHQISNHWFLERLYRTLHVVVLILISYLLPNVTRMMGVLGSLFTTPAVMIYPAIIEMILDWEYPGLGKYRWRLVKCISIVIVGLVTVFGGTYFNIVGMIEEIQLQNSGGFRPNYSHHNNHDDQWKSYVYLRIDTEVNPSIYLYNNSDMNVNFYDTMSKNSTHEIRNFNASSFLPYNKTYELPEPIIPSLKNVDLNNSAVYVMPGLRHDFNDIIVINNKNNTIDGSTTLLSNDVFYITPESTSVIVYDKNTITDESIIHFKTDIVTIQTDVNIDTSLTTATDDKIDKELSNVTDTIASVIKNDHTFVGLTETYQILRLR